MTGMISSFKPSRREFITRPTTHNGTAQMNTFPTVVIALHGELGCWFASRLDKNKILVIKTGGVADILNVVITHSRPIHALLLDNQIEDQGLCQILVQYRPKMAILKVTSEVENDKCEALRQLTAAVRNCASNEFQR